ncbi:DUF4184 family protein [Acinetobacter guillouiae]|uniref:DUF4184 family protein n=1 Tax=Acinetobacter guillouiae TaxID=106649 RepID=UPI002E21FCC2
MPFTLSHAVLAPPLSKLSGNRLPIAALAIGTMTPDLYRVLVKTEIHLNHQFKGIIYPDLLVGLLFCLLWYSLYRPLLFKFLGIQKPLNIACFSTFFQFLIWMVLAIILGTATHIIWDGLTHLDFRTFAFKEFLAQPISIFDRIYPMHKVLQIGCSAVALPFLMWMGLHYFFKYSVSQIRNPKVNFFCISLFVTAFFSGCLYYVYIAKSTGFIPQDTDLYVLIGFFMKVFTQGSVLCFTLGCLLFHYLNYKKYFQ